MQNSRVLDFSSPPRLKAIREVRQQRVSPTTKMTVVNISTISADLKWNI